MMVRVRSGVSFQCAQGARYGSPQQGRDTAVCRSMLGARSSMTRGPTPFRHPADQGERLDKLGAARSQAFQLAGGSLRYYVRAHWKSGREKPGELPFSLAAWMTPPPSLHILAVEKRISGYHDLGLPELLNVVDLGNGRTGIILEV